METELMQNSICEGLPHMLLEMKDFQKVLKAYLEDETAICEKKDAGITFSFPFYKATYGRAYRRQKVKPSPRSFSFWQVDGFPGYFALKTSILISDDKKIVNSVFLLGMYIPEKEDETVYIMRTDISLEKKSWFSQISIGNKPTNSANCFFGIQQYANITIFEQETRFFQDICIDDARLEGIENPVRRIALQELSKKTKSVIADLQKGNDLTLTYQPK